MEDPQQITDDMVRDFISLCATKGYQIRKKIGDGSFGITYLGIRRERAGPGDDGSCAIKLALDNKMLHQVYILTSNLFFPFYFIIPLFIFL